MEAKSFSLVIVLTKLSTDYAALPSEIMNNFPPLGMMGRKQLTCSNTTKYQCTKNANTTKYPCTENAIIHRYDKIPMY